MSYTNLPRPQECVCGDARSEETYARALRGEKAALLLTDPPYCLLTRRRKGGEPREKRRDVKIDRDPVVRFEAPPGYFGTFQLLGVDAMRCWWS